MSSVKPEPGMTYDFDVVDAFYFQNGSIIITGTTSSNYARLYPAAAEVFVNGNSIGTISITEELHPRSVDHTPDHEKSLVTYDKIDLKSHLSDRVSLKCVFTESCLTPSEFPPSQRAAR